MVEISEKESACAKKLSNNVDRPPNKEMKVPLNALNGFEPEAHKADDNNAANELERKASLRDVKIKSELPKANLSLVKEVQKLLVEEFEQMEAKGEENFFDIYSRVHYEHLTDSKSPNTCWRYLLQRDLDVEAAFQLAKAALKWREQNNADGMQASEMIKDFWLRAPMGFTGKTKSGNDLVYAMSKNYRKPDACVRQVTRDYVTYLLFDWDRRHRHDLAQIEMVFDVRETGLRNMDLDWSSWLVSIRDFVPARIKAIYFVGMPFIVRPIIRLIISWLPERFRRIVLCGTYDELVTANVDDESIPEEIGGKADNKWRLAPVEAKWIHDIDGPDTDEIFEEICKCCNFNTTKEYLDKVYKMQIDYENDLEKRT